MFVPNYKTRNDYVNVPRIFILSPRNGNGRAARQGGRGRWLSGRS